MSTFRRRILPLLLAAPMLLVAIPSRADLIFEISTDQQDYRVGEMIEWSIAISVTGIDDTSENFGLSSVSLNLRDTSGSPLVPGTINSDVFGPAYFKSGGTYEDSTQRLLDISASAFLRSSSTLNTVGERSNIAFASGSYEATAIGAHSLVGSADSNINFNAYFNSSTDEFSTSPFSATTFNNASFSVSAVPEPGASILLLVSGIWMTATHRRRPTLPRRHATPSRQKRAVVQQRQCASTQAAHHLASHR